MQGPRPRAVPQPSAEPSRNTQAHVNLSATDGRADHLTVSRIVETYTKTGHHNDHIFSHHISHCVVVLRPIPIAIHYAVRYIQAHECHRIMVAPPSAHFQATSGSI